MAPITNTEAENMFVEGIGQIEVKLIVVTDLAMVILAGSEYMNLNSISFIDNAALDPQIVRKYITVTVALDLS
jgi:hypothetical protein